MNGDVRIGTEFDRAAERERLRAALVSAAPFLVFAVPQIAPLRDSTALVVSQSLGHRWPFS